jgi:hypothetical protein
MAATISSACLVVRTSCARKIRAPSQAPTARRLGAARCRGDVVHEKRAYASRGAEPLVARVSKF